MTKWIADPAHSEVHFKIKHLVISTVSGAFKKFEGSFESSKDDLSDAKINFTVTIQYPQKYVDFSFSK